MLDSGGFAMDDTAKATIFHTVGSAVAIACALVISGRFHQPILGWAIGAALIALSAQLTFVPPVKRTALRMIGAVLVSGAVMALLVALIGPVA
jgi:uncharacterized membrane protein